MQRLDRQRHADLARVVERRRDAVLHLLARAGDVLGQRGAGERAGQAADDEHEAGGVQRLRLVDGAAVVVERGLAAGGIDRREHAAAAVAGQRQAVRAHQRGGALQADRRDLVAPRRDRADAVAGAGLDDRVERAGAAQGGGVDRQPAVVGREVAHGRGGLRRRRRAAPAAAASASPRARAFPAGRPGRRGGRRRRSAAANARSAARRPS